ncbi:hypothetical protein AQJ91_30820 [Streptomyces dysideae]|uniref:Uncharacterized protein n=1 Tax=Streptomyces dysideae TaxID=909626 RepID=A0A117RZQ4_9ACTN|nr:hypothetical protein AQJ91_30820 [Streptomyces dysideae]
MAQNAPDANRDVPNTNQVVVFSSELLPLQAYPDPRGCQQLPTISHVLYNETSRVVLLHADPYCLTPGIAVQPGYGAHTSQASGSFSIT